MRRVWALLGQEKVSTTHKSFLTVWFCIYFPVRTNLKGTWNSLIISNSSVYESSTSSSSRRSLTECCSSHNLPKRLSPGCQFPVSCRLMPKMCSMSCVYLQVGQPHPSFQEPHCPSLFCPNYWDAWHGQSMLISVSWCRPWPSFLQCQVPHYVASTSAWLK